MRGVREYAGRVTRLRWDEERAAFVAEEQDHPFRSGNGTIDPQDRPADGNEPAPRAGNTATKGC